MFEEVKKIGWLVPLLCVIFGLCARGDIQPVSDIVVSVQAGNPEHIWLAAVQIKDLEISTDRLVNGHSTGMATAAVPLYNEITNADNMDLNLFAARNNEDPPEWRITDLGGHALYWDTNGDQPDFLLFETNGNDDIQVQAILPDGSLGQEVAISKSMWGDTGLRITASTHTNQKIKGMAWSLTDLLDAQGLPLTGFQAIAGIQITSPGLDPACFCAVQGAMANQLPQVEAGESIDLLVPDNAALLSGTVTDDGQGDPNGYLFYQWAWKEGPGEVIFEPNCFVLSPSVILLGGPGIYVLELTATDGTLESSDQVTLYLQSTDIMGRIVLNELLATDDPDSKDTEDWIELYNPTDLPVDIAGYFLTDDPDDPLRWRVPGGDRDLTTISPGGFLRIWADGGFAPGLHASFELDSQGETVALYGPDGFTLMDLVTFAKLPVGIAWGREPDGSDRWVTLNPSPGQSNKNHALPLVADTKFSVDRGFFEMPFAVTMTCATEDATIVYTTDGSLPTLSHGIEGPSPVTVTISTTTVLRAMAFKDGMRSTDVDTQTYLFLSDVIRQPAHIQGYPNPRTWLGGSAYDDHDYEMDPGIVDDADYRSDIIPSLLAVPTLSIAVEPSELADENGFYWGSGEAPCSVELIFPKDPNENVHVNAGVEPHSHDRLKRSLRLNFRSEYGDAKLKTSLMRTGSLFGSSATDTFDRLILRGGNNRSWARVWNPDKTTYAVDQFYRDSQVALSGYGSRGAFVHLYINGLYWGLYNPVERTDHWFTSRYFEGDPEDWFAIHHGSQSVPGFHGDSSRYQMLVNDLIHRDQSIADNYALTCAYLDTENFCDYMLFTWWMGVGDWPGNNWYAGCRTDSSPLGPTPLRFFAWDGEWSWDASRAGGPGYVHPDFRSNKNSSNSLIPQIWHALRRNDDFMTLFADRVYRHFFHGGSLTEEAGQERWLMINEQIRSAVVAESARWGDAMKNQGQPTRTRNEDWQQEVDVIYSMIEGNSRQFLDHLRQQAYYPRIDPPEFSARDAVLSVEHELWLTNPNTSGVVYYTTHGSDPRSMVQSSDVHMATGSVVLPYSCQVKTRVLAGDTWSALNETTLGVGPVAHDLRVSEIMYHLQNTGDVNDSRSEFIELTNVGSKTINLNLVQFTQGVTFTFPVYELDSGAYVLVVKDVNAFSAGYLKDLPIAGQYQGSLSNGGERIVLMDAVGQTIVDFEYQDDWYPSTDGRGQSLEVIDPRSTLDLSLPDAWQPSHEIGGTPGLSNI